MPPALLTAADVARLCQVRERTVRTWVERRMIAYVKLGRYIRFRRTDVEAFIQASSYDTGPDRRWPEQR